MYTLHYTYEASQITNAAIRRLIGIRKFGNSHTQACGSCYCCRVLWWDCPRTTATDIQHMRSAGFYVPDYV